MLDELNLHQLGIVREIIPLDVEVNIFPMVGFCWGEGGDPRTDPTTNRVCIIHCGAPQHGIILLPEAAGSVGFAGWQIIFNYGPRPAVLPLIVIAIAMELTHVWWTIIV